MLKFTLNLDFTYKLRCRTLTIFLKLLLNVLLSTLSSQNLVLRTNFWLKLSELKSPILNNKEMSLFSNKTSQKLLWPNSVTNFFKICLMLTQLLFSKTLNLLKDSKSPRKLQLKLKSPRLKLKLLKRLLLNPVKSTDQLPLKEPCCISC